MQSAALWFNPPPYNHLPSVNLYALSSVEILLLPALSSIDASPGDPTTVLVGAPSGSFEAAGGLWNKVKLVLTQLFTAYFCASRCRI